MQIVTEALLDLGVDSDKEINKSQLLLLDMKAEQTEHWREEALGKSLSDARVELFVLLNGMDDVSLQEKVIANYKALQKFRKKPQPKAKPKPIIAPSIHAKVTLYCDGGCTPNPGKAGSGVALYRDECLESLWYGLYEPMGTNNTAELGALYQSLLLAQEEIQQGNSVEIKCDSMYSINCIKTWAISWEKKGWTKKGGEIKNLDIIKQAYALYTRIKKEVNLSHIKAHAGFEGNELADRMTMYAIAQQSKAFVCYDKEIDVLTILAMRAG